MGSSPNHEPFKSVKFTLEGVFNDFVDNLNLTSALRMVWNGENAF